MNLTIVQKSNQIDYRTWSNFVGEHPNGNIFQTPYMYEVYRESKNYKPLLLFIEDSGGICGILLAVVQNFGGKIAGSLASRSLIIGGPLVRNNDKLLLKKLLGQYSLAIKEKAIYTEVRNSFNTNKQNQTFSKMDFHYEDHLDIHIDLQKDLDELWNELHKTRRKQIKRGQLRGAKVSEVVDYGNELEIIDCYKILTEVYKRVNLPLPPIEFFRSAINSLEPKGFLKIFTAKYENEIIGCRWVLCYNDIIYDWYAGSLQNHYDKYPNDILPWEIVKWGNENNYRIFDFGGAGKPGIPYGVRDYKLKFGGRIVNFGRYQKIHQPIAFKFAKIGFSLLRWTKQRVAK